ncbi:hypothetical protein [Sphingomonas sp. CFBP 13720]|uniref:hypothetical protein n=1 Tax=Sphingomonas sp. CFBP 13720 TaxID=2775302 RepID=UPI001784695F|nr:hypothetical protein [Sphingomonas sp. CFBP 13720]MBD8679352.1 hypothetical protein [Sphingomonas sp. CFBP 13720]
MAAVTIQPPVDRLPHASGIQSVSAPAVRFADLLTASSSASALSPRDEVRAERFNQDGFFGSAVAGAVPVVSAIPPAAVEPVEGPIEVVASQIAVSGAGAGTTGTVVAGRIVQATMPERPTAGRSAPVSLMLRAPGIIAGATPRPADLRAPVRAAASALAPKSPAVRQPPLPAGAFVAVAVHAAARGIEVAAQVDGLSEQERSVLADEVAGMLSAHGYPPAYVTIIAAPRGLQRERR